MRTAARLAAFALVAAHGGAFGVSVTLLAPNPLAVPTVDGKGSVTAFLKIEGGPSQSGSVRVTDLVPPPRTPTSVTPLTAVAGITDIYQLTISVDAGRAIDPSSHFQGTLLIPTRTGAETVSFQLSEQPRPSMEVTPSRLDAAVFVGKSGSLKLRVKNTGAVPLDKLEIASLGLRDPATQRILDMPAAAPSEAPAIAPDREGDVMVPLPRPFAAGVYTGTLDIRFGGRTLKSIPITLSSRGPYAWTGLPYLLFVLVVAGGFALSNALDRWFGGDGRRRALLVVRSAELTRRLTAAKGALVALDSAGVKAPRGSARLVLELAEAGHLTDDFASIETEPLTARINALGDPAAAAEVLIDALREAAKPPPSAARDDLVAALDGVDPQPLSTYLARLATVLGTGGGAVAQAVSSAAVLERIGRYDRLQDLAVLGAVLITAYLTFFAAKASFGSATDYAGLLLWSLGLTQTGTQIVSRARAARPQTP